MRPYLDELGPRVDYVEKELREAALEAKETGGPSGYLCGGFSYADLFTLPIVLLCAKYVFGGNIDPSTHPHTAAWVDALMARPSGDCVRIMREMVVLHGNPDVKQLSEFGYDYEVVGGMVYDPFIREECLNLLRQVS